MGIPSAISLINQAGRRFAAASDQAVILSSAQRTWTSPLVFEVHRMGEHAYEEHVLVHHRLIVNLGAPLLFGWKRGDRPQEALLGTGGLCLQSDGDHNTDKHFNRMRPSIGPWKSPHPT